MTFYVFISGCIRIINKLSMIKEISFSEIFHVWNTYLWPNRNSPIESNSAMVFLGGFEMGNMTTTPTFFGYFVNHQLVGVNSGHRCIDNGYRSRGVYVFPEYRKRQIGKQLLEATINQGRKEQCNFVWSFPRKTSWNTYKSAGFSLVGDWEKSETSEANAYCIIKL
jgi:GNAT superfamily N-acetyltransferase